jgi:hypothetical protein
LIQTKMSSSPAKPPQVFCVMRRLWQCSGLPEWNEHTSSRDRANHPGPNAGLAAGGSIPMLFGACRFVRLHRTSEHDMRRNLCRTISLGHCGDVLQRVPGLIVLVSEGMATNQGSDAIPLMGHAR